MKNRFTEQQIENIHKLLKEMKTAEDILTRAKAILRKYSDQTVINEIRDSIDQMFLRILFSFHPTRELPQEADYPISVGRCSGFPSFLIQSK